MESLMDDGKKKNDIPRVFELIYLIMNGFAVGNTINATRDMVNNGYSQEKMAILGLWALLSVYSGARWYQLFHKNKNNNNNNQKTR